MSESVKGNENHEYFFSDSLESTNLETSFEMIDMVVDSPPPIVSHQQRKASRRQQNTRVLSTLGVVAITYFYGCGGPIGTETIVSSGGPLIAMIALVVYPIFMTLPYAWIVAELCSAFPEDGGFTIWVYHAFGPFWAFQTGYWSWVSGIIIGALIPALLINLIASHIGEEVTSSFTMYLLKAAIAAVLTVPVLLGTKCIARICISLLVLTLVPYLIFIGFAYATEHDYDDLPVIRHANITVFGREDVITEGPIYIDWATLINGLFWNYDGINIASVFGGEVQNPARVYSRAIFITVALSLITIIVPVPAAVISGDTYWSQYVQGSYTFVAKEIGGSLCEIAVVFSAACSIIGLFMSSLFCKSFEISGMAQKNLLPELFGKKNRRFGSPHISIVISAGLMISLCGIDFNQLIPTSNAFSCAVELLILMTVIRLRYELPYIARPTKVKGGVPALVIMAIFPFLVLGFLLYEVFKDPFQATMTAAFILPGLVYGWYEFYFKSN